MFAKGVVIGFVLSYRAPSITTEVSLSFGSIAAMTGTGWAKRLGGDVVRNTRTLSRLIWFHVPLRLTLKTPEESASGKVNRPVSELNKVMAESVWQWISSKGTYCLTNHHAQ